MVEGHGRQIILATDRNGGMLYGCHYTRQMTESGTASALPLRRAYNDVTAILWRRDRRWRLCFHFGLSCLSVRRITEKFVNGF